MKTKMSSIWLSHENELIKEQTGIVRRTGRPSAKITNAIENCRRAFMQSDAMEAINEHC